MIINPINSFSQVRNCVAIIFYNKKNLYWAPPGTELMGNFIEDSLSIDYFKLNESLDQKFGLS